MSWSISKIATGRNVTWCDLSSKRIQPQSWATPRKLRPQSWNTMKIHEIIWNTYGLRRALSVPDVLHDPKSLCRFSFHLRTTHVKFWTGSLGRSAKAVPLRLGRTMPARALVPQRKHGRGLFRRNSLETVYRQCLWFLLGCRICSGSSNHRQIGFDEINLGDVRDSLGLTGPLHMIGSHLRSQAFCISVCQGWGQDVLNQLGCRACHAKTCSVFTRNDEG